MLIQQYVNSRFYLVKRSFQVINPRPYHTARFFEDGVPWQQSVNVLEELADLVHPDLRSPEIKWDHIQKALQVLTSVPIPRAARRKGCEDVFDLWHWRNNLQRNDWKKNYPLGNL